MSASRLDIFRREVWLSFARLRYELGIIAGALGVGVAVIVVMAGLTALMIAVVASLMKGMTTFIGLTAAGGLGFIFGACSASVLLPCFGTVTREDLAAEHARVAALRSAMAVDAQLARERKAAALQEASKQKAEVIRRQHDVATTKRSIESSDIRAVQRKVSGRGVCWYCGQPTGHLPLQCGCCRMVSRLDAA